MAKRRIPRVTPQVVSGALLVVGIACVITGVQLLVGTAWAFITAGVLLLALTVALIRGIANG